MPAVDCVKKSTAGEPGNGVMARYVAFLLLGSAFVTGMVMTVQTHRLVIEPKAQFTNTPVNYVDSHWPASVPAKGIFFALGTSTRRPPLQAALIS